MAVEIINGKSIIILWWAPCCIIGIKVDKMFVKKVSIVSLNKFYLLSFNIFKNNYLVSNEFRVLCQDIQLQIYFTLNSLQLLLFKNCILLSFNISWLHPPLPPLLPVRPHLPSPPDPLLLLFHSEQSKPPRGIKGSWTQEDSIRVHTHTLIWMLDEAPQ